MGRSSLSDRNREGMRHCPPSQIGAINLRAAYDHYSPLAFQAALLNLVLTDIFAKLDKSSRWGYSHDMPQNPQQ